jgi:NodT family efflux transporter outer membrane factor (OMF) lipoprotein
MKKRLLSATVLVGVLSACATKRAQYATPDVTLPASFRDTAKIADDPLRRVSPLKNVLPDWWRLLGNPELNELVDRALANNHDLRIAGHRIAQAQARIEQARADQLPVISLPYSANIAAPAEGVGLLPAGGEFASKRTYQASVRADWRPDLWGEVQAMYESSELQLWRATFARDDIQRALVANIVSTYTNYLSLCDRLRIAEESEAVLSGLLASVRERMDSGDATIIEFEQQRAAVFQVRATIPQLVLQRDQAKNRLASLAGTVPRALHLAEHGLDTLSYPVVVTGLPSALLLRRPDVRVVEATMLAADANIDAARARMFPQLDISAQYGAGSFTFSQLLQPASVFWSGLASVSATIFDHGKRANDVAIARSVHEELLETYIQTLYNAVREVEDAQAGIASIGKRLTIQQESVDAALSAWTYSRESYEAGAIDYMVLLDTERTYHARLDELNRIRLENFLALVELFQAIGGGADSSDSFPGKGRRPVPPPEVEVGLVQSVEHPDNPAVQLSPSKLVDGYGKRWLAELPGVSSYASVLAARRDLYARFPDLMTRQRIVLVRQDGRSAQGQDRERLSWYRIFVGAFPDAAASEHFCAVLKTQFMRCNALPNSSAELSNSGKWLQLSPAPAAPGQTPDTPSAPGGQGAIPAIAHGPAPAVAVAVANAATTTSTAARAFPRRVGPPQFEPAGMALSKAGPPQFEPATLSKAGTPDKRNGTLAKVTVLSLRPPLPPAGKPLAPPSNGRTGYAVQVYSLQYAGRFTSSAVDGLKKRFERSLLQWRAKGYTPYLYKAEAADANLVISICIGAFSKPGDASALASRIRAREPAAVVVVPIGRYDNGNPIAFEAPLGSPSPTAAGASELAAQSLIATGAK